MIIYLEGPDASGKSTLKASLIARLETLASIRNIKIVPDGEKLIPTRPGIANIPRCTYRQLVNNLEKMARKLDTVYICDRGPISDVIYRAFDKYLPIINLEDYRLIWLTNSQFIVTVHCDTDLSTELLAKRGDNNPIAIANHQALRYLYRQIMPLFDAFKYDLSTIKTPNDQLSVNNSILARLWNGLANMGRANGIPEGDK